MAPTPRTLEGLAIAVVGGNGGLGTPIANELRARGADVLECSRTGTVPIDVRDAGAGDAVVAAATERFGRLDGVVVASGVVGFGNLADTDDVIVEELMLTNALGPMWLARRVLPALAEQDGFFAAVTGVVADTPQPGMAAYSASKAALAAGLTAIRREFRREKVAVIDVRPPHTETGLATRPIAGTAPRMPTGLEPSAVATRIVDAIAAGENVVTADEFA